LKIALDATYSVGRNLSGVGVYSHRILAGLAAAHPDRRFLACYRPHRFWRGLQLPVPGNVSPALLWKNSPWGVDLFHGLNQRVDRRYKRTVTTFHDLFVITGEYSTPEFRARFALQARQAAERSDLIIAVSAFTASQVEDLLGIPQSRIRMIHHGTDRAEKISPLNEKTILFVGAIQKRKNVLRLVQAFEQAQPGWRLVLAGGSGYGAEEILQAIEHSPRRSHIELRGYVNSSELARLYQTASIFAFPSLDEGFGMPVLDAMAHGIPVLTSNTSALAEIAGGAARLVDPHDTAAIFTELSELMRNETLRRQLGKLGIEHSSKFTWEQAAAKTWSVYRELLD
jgi:glycosyltransferase involved in cell wall biosynthesis